MSVARQSSLLAGESWTAIYRAFSATNFNASDPPTINAALRNYIQVNYPENFNDWIVSSEFVAIIDLLSWLAGTLAFKTDLAARENFIDTAEARESILRLARFLSYNPSRCQPAIGILKVTAVATDDDVFDSFGVNQANQTIVWNDPNNSNWFEQFTLILNNAFVKTNPVGVPLSEGSVNNIATQLYRVNGFASDSPLGFGADVSGTSMAFEVCNADFGATLFEREPDPNNAFQFYYLDDGNSNASAHTGFFLLFKQGNTLQQTFTLTVPIQNQMLDIISTGVNQTDVWVDTVDDNGAVLINWTQVPAMLSSNITYNNIPADQRNIFSVITRDNDQISIRFSDGNFGNAPIGNIRVTYRVSNGLEYQIKPSEMSGIVIPISYVNLAGNRKTLSLTVGLAETIDNAAAAETIEQIRQRAPQVYATQNRMVSGEDYNTFPLRSNLAIKVKAVNRVYSGQSRYSDLHDPTGTFQDLSLFADDGIFFRDRSDTFFEVPQALTKTSAQIYTDYIQPALDQYTTSNLIRDVLMQNVRNGTITAPSHPALTWTASSASLFATTGWFNLPNNLVQPGSMLQLSIKGTPTWVAVIDVQSSITTVPPPNTAGPVTLSQEVVSGSPVLAILPQALTIPAADVVDTINSNLVKRLSFSLWYDYATDGGSWLVQPPHNDFGQVEPALQGTTLLIMNVNYITGLWRINSRGLRYVFESLAAIQWFDNGQRTLAQLTGQAARDTVRVLRINQDLSQDSRGFALDQPYDLTIDRLWTYPDGTTEPRRTTVLFADSNADGYPDHPDLYYSLVADAVPSSYVFWSSKDNPPYDQPMFDVTVFETDTLRKAASLPALGTVAFQVKSDVSYVFDETFWVVDSTGWRQDTVNYRAARGRGPNTAAAWVTASSGTVLPFSDGLAFQWKHYAPSDHRINPAATNIIDIFVLTYAYDGAIRRWIANGAVLPDKPLPPSELDLSIAFAGLEDAKMFSDAIVWRPVRYKLLFGQSADPAVQAQFKVVRLQNASVSDGEIQSRVIAAINAFFDIARWDFGETFYFTELAAYIHQQNVGLISSVVIVPLAASASFGDGFEISCDTDEVFISTAQVSDVLLIPTNSAVNLRIASLR